MPRFSIPFELRIRLSLNDALALSEMTLFKDGTREKEMEKDSFHNTGVCLTRKHSRYQW